MGVQYNVVGHERKHVPKITFPSFQWQPKLEAKIYKILIIIIIIKDLVIS
jgi:hypothetical protein